MRSLLALAVVAGTGSVASAGVYIGLGVGTAPSVSDSNNSAYQSDGRSAKLQVGYGWELSTGRISVEGTYLGFAQTLGDSYSGHFDNRTMQVAGKYNFPLGNNFEVFGKVGVLRTDLNYNLVNTSSSGTGYTLGLGAEYRIQKWGGVFIDYSRNKANFQPDNITPQDQTTSMWMMGVNVYL